MSAFTTSNGPPRMSTFTFSNEPQIIQSSENTTEPDGMYGITEPDGTHGILPGAAQPYIQNSVPLSDEEILAIWSQYA